MDAAQGREKKWIYLDNAATTRIRREALDSMQQYLGSAYGNPGGMYHLGYQSKKALTDARSIIARTINAKSEEIFFVSGGTEADNLAIRGIMENDALPGNHMITSAIEHSAVLNTCRYLRKRGYDITIVPVDKEGRISVDEVRKAIRPTTKLISVMTANNEIGTIQPIEEIGKLAQQEGIKFHTDAVQAYAQIPIDVMKWNVDLLGVSAHKFYGPKGVGFLYVRNGTLLEPLIRGGGQEQGLRAGTENVPGIVGMATAAKITCAEIENNDSREKLIRNEMIRRMLEVIPECRLDGSLESRLPNNIHVCIPGIDGEMLVRLLDKDHIAVATGAACSANKKEISHVLEAIGIEREIARGSLRISISKDTTMEEATMAVTHIAEEIKCLRRMS